MPSRYAPFRNLFAARKTLCRFCHISAFFYLYIIKIEMRIYTTEA
nr:MAG TPA: protein of unknown function (DUF2024) [Caudoviricetes sp.]